MSECRPTLSELRARVQKARHRELGNLLARHYARPTAVYGTWLAVRLGLSAHAVTVSAFIVSLSGAIAIGSGGRLGFIGGVLMLQLAFWLDHVDGQVARWRRTASLDGVYFDYLMHHAAGWALGFALGYGLAVRTGFLPWTIAGFSISVGWSLLSLHNDCRYKSFFQRLKSTKRSFRVDGGSGARPTPPPGPPRTPFRFLVWAAYKLCEPHIVLQGVSILGIFAILEPRLWLSGWRVSVVIMALAAPLLGLIRIARSITRHAAEHEFSRWFHELNP